MFCTKCGNTIDDGARFCTRCGAPVQAVTEQPQTEAPQQYAPAQQTYQPQRPAQQALAYQQPQQTYQPPQPVQQAAPQPAPQYQQAASQAAGYAQPATQQAVNLLQTQAPATGGEFMLGTLQSGFSGAITSAASSLGGGAIQGPGATIGAGFKQFFSSVAGGFKNPKMLIPTIVLAVIWLILNILQACGINPLPTQVLSFLTFAEGGMKGGIVGAIGGIIGKGVFAGAVTTLIGMIGRKSVGQKRSFGDIIKGSLGVSMDTLWGYMTGIGTALILYVFMAGFSAP